MRVRLNHALEFYKLPCYRAKGPIPQDALSPDENASSSVKYRNRLEKAQRVFRAYINTVISPKIPHPQHNVDAVFGRFS